MEQRLIDGNALKGKAYKGGDWEHQLVVDWSDIEDAPTVDAVPVVRCGECKHARNLPHGLCYKNTEPNTSLKGYKGEVVCVEKTDFCSYGERRE